MRVSLMNFTVIRFHISLYFWASDIAQTHTHTYNIQVTETLQKQISDADNLLIVSSSVRAYL